MKKYIGKFLIICPLTFGAMSVNAAAEALLGAVESADYEEVKRLLINNPEAVDKQYNDSRQFSLPFDLSMKVIVKNFTLLHIAAGWGDLPMLKLLLNHKANPSREDESGLIPADIPGLFLSHENASRKYRDCLLLLIEHSKGG